MITEKQACILKAHGYKLVDKEGNVFVIMSLLDNAFVLEIQGLDSTKGRIQIYKSRIGKDYHILCLPHEALTKEIEGKTPIVELAKIAFPYNNWGMRIRYNDAFDYGLKQHFSFLEDTFISEILGVNHQYLNVPNQQLLFDTLYDMHFPPYGIGEENLKYKTI